MLLQICAFHFEFDFHISKFHQFFLHVFSFVFNFFILMLRYPSQKVLT